MFGGTEAWAVDVPETPIDDCFEHAVEDRIV